MTSDNLIDDLATAICILCGKFEKHDLPTPTVIEISYKAKEAILLAARNYSNSGINFVVDYKEPQKVFGEVELMGVKLRWEARKVAKASGGFSYE